MCWQKLRENTKTKTLNLIFLLANFFFGDDSFQNMIVYQTKLNILELKKIEGTDYVIG